jgi:hypothetical protein
VDKPRHCEKCGLGLAVGQTTASCPRCHPVKFRCDRCRSALAPLEAWPTHPRQGYACCVYCGDVVTKYVCRTCDECEGKGYFDGTPSPGEPCTACGMTGRQWVKA